MGGERENSTQPQPEKSSTIMANPANIGFVVVDREDTTAEASSQNSIPADIIVVDEDVGGPTDAVVPSDAPLSPGTFKAVGLTESTDTPSKLPSVAGGSNSTEALESTPHKAPTEATTSPMSHSTVDSAGPERGNISPPPPPSTPEEPNASDDAEVDIGLPSNIIAGVAFVYVWRNIFMDHVLKIGKMAFVCKDKGTDFLVSAQRCARRKWTEHPHPALKRLLGNRLVSVLLILVLSLIVVARGRWVSLTSRDGRRRVTPKEWQAKYDALEQQYVAQSRVADEYNTLGAKHAALQEEHEALLNLIKVQERRSVRERDLRASTPPQPDYERRTGHNFFQLQEPMDLGTMGKDASPWRGKLMKESLLAAEQSAYRMFKHFSDGLKEDVQEIKEKLSSIAHNGDGSDRRDRKEKNSCPNNNKKNQRNTAKHSTKKKGKKGKIKKAKKHGRGAGGDMTDSSSELGKSTGGRMGARGGGDRDTSGTRPSFDMESESDVLPEGNDAGEDLTETSRRPAESPTLPKINKKNNAKKGKASKNPETMAAKTHNNNKHKHTPTKSGADLMANAQTITHSGNPGFNDAGSAGARKNGFGNGGLAFQVKGRTGISGDRERAKIETPRHRNAIAGEFIKSAGSSGTESGFDDGAMQREKEGSKSVEKTANRREVQPKTDLENTWKAGQVKDTKRKGKKNKQGNKIVRDGKHERKNASGNEGEGMKRRSKVEKMDQGRHEVEQWIRDQQEKKNAWRNGNTRSRRARS